jgi:CHAT domain-containing protein/Tfp pilus assembly protein PilF
MARHFLSILILCAGLVTILAGCQTTGTSTATSTASALYKQADTHYEQGRYADAEPLFKRSLAIYEKALGPEHGHVAGALNALAELYYAQGRYADAEPLFKRSLAILEKTLGPEHTDVATILNNLAITYTSKSRYADAEPLFKRVLAIRERAHGPEHRRVATTLFSLAGLYRAQGRYADAELLGKRSLAILEKTLGPEHTDVAAQLNGLATIYNSQSRYADAELLFKRSLAIQEKTLGPDHPNVATPLNNIAFLYRDQGRYADAEPLFKRALAIFEKALGPDHSHVAISMNNLAKMYTDQGRYADAEPLFKRSLAILEKALGPEHPLFAKGLKKFAKMYRGKGQMALALDYIRRSSTIHRSRTARAGGRSLAGLSEQKQARPAFVSHVRYAVAVADKEPSKRALLAAEAFEAGQLAKATSTGAAIAGMSARFATGDDALARMVRERQDGADAWQRLDKRLVQAASKSSGTRDKAAEQRMRDKLAQLDRTLSSLDQRLNREFPEYAELTSPKPASLADVKKLLGPGEAMLSYIVGKDSDEHDKLDENQSFLWVVRRDRARMFKLDIGQDELDKTVQALLSGLDPTGVTSLASVPQYDTAQAHRLYKTILGPAKAMLGGINHFFIVPDGALQSLPFGVLVTGNTQGDLKEMGNYRRVPWLAKDYAMTTLPSVSSLRALRRFANNTRAPKPFGGIGDPLLKGHPGANRGLQLASLFSSRGIADVDAVRSRLAPLPETADELQAMARILGGSPSDLYLRDRATESLVKSSNLEQYRVLSFATHGLIAGDLAGVAEPSLVLTPPKHGTQLDDGLLTASEVAQLKLNADIVVLSACNTAASDGSPEAEALSGLAKAFFYAGSRSILVSHWPVGSDAAVQLTTKMLTEAANDNTVGLAEGLRRSMQALINTPDTPHFAHPMFWAPFVVVGEGAVHRVN